MAILVHFVFNALPLLLLLLYPLRCFQRCLNRCRLRSLALTTFMDVFQGHYKDGINGTRDCRYFSATGFVLQFLWYIVYASTLSVYFFPIMVVVFVGVSALMVTFKPYKSPPYNSISTILFLMLVLFCNSIHCAATARNTQDPSFSRFSMIMAFSFSFVPLVYFTGLVLYLVVLHKRLPRRALQRCWSRSTQDNDCSEELLPDRLLNPENYSDLEDVMHYN